MVSETPPIDGPVANEETISITPADLAELIREEVRGAVASAMPSDTNTLTKDGDMKVGRKKRRIPSHMRQPIFRPGQMVVLKPESPKNRSTELLEEWDLEELGEEGVKEALKSGEVIRQRKRGSTRPILHRIIDSTLKGVPGEVMDLPQNYTKAGVWKYPISWGKGLGEDNCLENELAAY